MDHESLKARVLIALAAACVYPITIAAQQDTKPTPPSKAQLCDDSGCVLLNWKDDHYDAYKTGFNGVLSQFWVKKWTAQAVELYGKSTIVLANGYPAEGSYTARVSSDGKSLVGGIVNWNIGPSMKGTKPFTFTWNAPSLAGRAQSSSPARSEISATSEGSAKFPPSTTFEQRGHSDPPKTMRLCVTNGQTTCTNLTYATEYYEARKDGETKVDSRYWITQWEDGHVQLTGKTAYAADGVFPIDSRFDDYIATDGAHLFGTLNWHVGPSASGTARYTLSWSKAPSNVLAAQYVGQFESEHVSKAHQNISLPPGATEAFAEFPDFMRAALQPESPLLPSDAILPCNSTNAVDAPVALEIGKFAYRKADFSGGHCWLKRSADGGNIRAQVLLGASALMGWGTAKNVSEAFQTFSKLDGKQDLWNAWFLEKCYLEGLGTPVNKQLASRIDTYLMLRPAGQELFLSIGSDDAEVRKQRARALVLLHPPTVSRQSCRPGMPTEVGVVNGQYCYKTQVVDEKEVQRRLDEINQQK